MKYLFSPEGEQALQQAVALDALFAFDYDGTLAPITGQYADASIPLAIVQSLKQLAQRGKVIIITGRSVTDASSRLGFTPHAIIGNHGAEGLFAANDGLHVAQVSHWRYEIEKYYGEALRDAGVALEDKRHSLTLHYRQARDVATARKLIHDACSLLPSQAKTFGGKCVVNIAPYDAPDKADALFATMEIEGAQTAIFVGDDLNDEVVFERAPPHWLTVRVGPDEQSAAHYYLERQDEMQRFIEAILERLQTG